MSIRITQISAAGGSESGDPHRMGGPRSRTYSSVKSGKAWQWKGADDLAALHWAEADYGAVSYEFRPHTLAISGPGDQRARLWTPDLLIEGPTGYSVVKVGTPGLRTMFGVDVVHLHEFYRSRGQQFSLCPPEDVTQWHKDVQAYRRVLVTEADREAVDGLDGDGAVRALNSRYQNEVVTMAKAAAMHVRRIIRLQQHVQLLHQVRNILEGER